MDDSRQIEKFRAELAREGRNYIYTNKPADDRAEIRFLGMFEGSELIWNANVMTLNYYNSHRAQAHLPVTTRQFIEVAETGNTARRITIGLDLTRIDPPALLKTIIMVRKYKRLRTGRHEFGGTPGSS